MLRESYKIIDRFRIPTVVLVAVGAIVVTACSGISHNTVHTGLAKSANPQLRLLAAYKNPSLEHEEMFFTYMPQTTDEAAKQAITLTKTLKEYGKQGVTPRIVMEPTDSQGNNRDLGSLSSAQSQEAFHTLFGNLKRAGITDQQMGTLIPFPEPDLPEWGGASTDPTIFAQNYKTVSNAFKDAFPNGKLSFLLDSTTYQSGDTSETNGDNSSASLQRYVTALQSVSGMPAIESVGFQGFPWSSTDKPADYLDHGIAEGLARSMGVKAIWFNTGTAESYGNTNVSMDVRTAQLTGEVDQAKATKADGFTVTVNLFGYKDPQVSWEYALSDSSATRLLSGAVNELTADGISSALFVSAGN